MSLTTIRVPDGWSFSVDHHPTETPIEWRLRYKPDLTLSERLQAASIMAQFAYLLDLSLSHVAAERKLREMRLEYVTYLGTVKP